MIATIDAQTTEIPAHPDGRWPHVMVNADGSITFADTATELVGQILGEKYQQLDDSDAGNDEALFMRHDAAVSIAATVQTALNRAAVEDGRLDLGTASERTLTALHHEKSVAWDDGDPGDGSFGSGPSWGLESDDEDIPMVLVSTLYQPYTQAPAPAGNIVWIDPGDEVKFLASLARSGIIGDYRQG